MVSKDFGFKLKKSETERILELEIADEDTEELPQIVSDANSPVYYF